MASIIQDLISVLEQERQIYEDLIPIVSQKKTVIIKNDLDTLQKITEQEQMAIDTVTNLEKKRSEVIFNISIVMNQKAEELTLAKIVSLLEGQPEEQKQLAKVHDNLKYAVQQIMNINSQNKSLIEQSLEMIEFNMKIFLKAIILKNMTIF